MLKFIYRKALSTCSSVFTLRRILLAAVLLYLLFLRLDPGWNSIDCNMYVNLCAIRTPFESNLFSLLFSSVSLRIYVDFQTSSDAQTDVEDHVCAVPSGSYAKQRTVKDWKKKTRFNLNTFSIYLTVLFLVSFCKILIYINSIYIF